MSKSLEQLIQEKIAQDLIDVPLIPGYQRVYEDHTYRGFYDMSPAEIQASIDDPFMKILREEISKEITRDIVDKIKNTAAK